MKKFTDKIFHHGNTQNTQQQVDPVTGQPVVVNTATTATNLPPGTTGQVLPPVVETIVKPTIVEQTLRPEKVTEVQPVIHREVDTTEIHQVQKHQYERVPGGPAVITMPPVIQETVKPHVINEIQPVLHREVPAPVLERVEQHVGERISSPPVITKEVVNETRPAVAAGGVPIASNTAPATNAGHKRL